MHLVMLFFAATLAFSHVYGAKILGLFPHLGRSHQMVFEPLLRTLAERGHHVTVVSFVPLNDPPENYTDINLQYIATLGLKMIDLNIFENRGLIYRVPYVGTFIKRATEFNPLAGIALNVCEKIIDWPPLIAEMQKEYDLVIVENFNTDCMLGLLHIHNVQAPIVAILSSNLMPWSANRIGLNDNPAHVPVLTLPYFTPKTFTERLTNTFFNYYYQYWYKNAIQMKEQAIIEKHYGRKIPKLEELGKNISLMLVNTYHALNGAKPLVPAVVEVGGMHLETKRKHIPHHIEKFLNESQHGVVLFSFGSVIEAMTMPKYKEQMFINVLSKLKQRVIWKYENSEEEGTLIGKGNILRVNWLPQYEMLQHKQVVAFLGHGGLLGMTEAIAAGKPMVVVPFFGDQSSNAAAAAAVGLAKVIPYFELTEHGIEAGLRDVLSAERRANAQRLSRIWHDRQFSPLETAVYWVERVIRWGHAAPLHTTARDLPFYQYALLDVAATFIGIIFAVPIIIWLAISQIYHLFTKSAKQKMQ